MPTIKVVVDGKVAGTFEGESFRVIFTGETPRREKTSKTENKTGNTERKVLYSGNVQVVQYNSGIYVFSNKEEDLRKVIETGLVQVTERNGKKIVRVSEENLAKLLEVLQKK